MRSTVNSISESTGYDRRTIKRVLTAAAISSEEFTLRQFIDAFVAWNVPDPGTGGRADLEREQTRLTKAKADIAEVERSKVRGEVIPVDTVLAVWENVAASIRRTIETSTLTKPEQDACLRELQAGSDPKSYQADQAEPGPSPLSAEEEANA